MATNGVLTGRSFFSATMVWMLVLLTVLCIFSMSLRAQTSDLVTVPVDPAVRVVLRGQHAPWALPRNLQGPVPGDTMLQHLTLVLKRSPQRQKAFEQFLQQLQVPASPSYHRWLTPIQVGKRFGASEYDIEAIAAWLRSQGLRVNSVANSRMMIDFSGTAALVGAAFATEMCSYVVNGEQRMATADDPQIPAALAGVIQSVSGLNTVNDHPYHGAEPAEVPAPRGNELPELSICNGGTCTNFVTPDDFFIIYDLSGAWNFDLLGGGQTIAIIGRAKVYDPDIENFQTLSGLTKQDPTVIVPPNGLDPGPPAGSGGTATGDQVEATLDVMRAGSVAPAATIDLVVSADDNGVSGLRIAAQYVVDTNPVPAYIMSFSFGACEADRSEADVQFWDTLFSQGAAEGISTFVASGDAGVAGCDAYFHTPPQNQIASPNYICSSSYSTCVGGTEFADAADPSLYWGQTSGANLASALSYIPEGGWNEPLNSQGGTQAAASGGGFSSYIATPTWQTGTGVPGTQGRYTPDIAFTSSAHDGYFGCLAASGGTHPGDCVVRNGSFYFEYFFGTSAAAPDMAGITALLNQKFQSPQGEINQRLYYLAANPALKVFNDVTADSSGVSGCAVTTPSICNNSTPSPTGLTGGLRGYLVTPGFDEVTGLGSIDVSNLLANWYAGFPATTSVVTSSVNPAFQGEAVTFTATISTAGTNPPTGKVTFFNSYYAFPFGAIGTAVLSTVNGSQVATFTTSTLPVGSYAVTAFYSGDANNADSISPWLVENVIAPTFAWTANGSSAGSVLAGQSAVYNFNAAPTGISTFTENVTFGCTPMATITCSFNPAQIAAGSGPVAVQLIIGSAGPNGPAANNKLRRRADRRFPWLPLTLPVAGIVMVGCAGRRISKPVTFAGLCGSLVLLGLLLACGGGGNSTPPPPPPISVTVGLGTPANLFPNDAADSWPLQTAQFTATVTNTTNKAVTWTATAGAIDANGLYTAPTVAANLPTSVAITATSAADPTKFATATETLNAATLPTPTGQPYTIYVYAFEGNTVNNVPVTLTVQ
jgi:subtilase family serine protease